jgi:hypothetical protein
VVARYRSRITVPWLRSINILAGVALAVFGGLLLADVAINGF